MDKILVLGTADWSQQIATNQHYMVRELAQENSLIYVESMGLRTPQLKARDLRRIARRLKPGITGEHRRPIPPTVEVRSPRIFPKHEGLFEKLNRGLVHRLVGDWMAQDTRLLWTYTPVTYGLEKHATSSVYHCVDLLGEIEGISRALISRNERVLSSANAFAIGSSKVVVSHLGDVGFTSPKFWPNVADTRTIAKQRPSDELRGRAPSAVFAGNLTTTKVDFEILESLIHAGVQVHLAGPISEGGGDARAEVDRLISLGAIYHGMLAPDELAALYWTATVGLIPYVQNEYTRGVSPLKAFEYLAAGLLVVSTDIPAVQMIPGHIVTESGSRSFIDAVKAASASQPTNSIIQERIRIADQHSWRDRGETARELVRQIVSTTGMSK